MEVKIKYGPFRVKSSGYIYGESAFSDDEHLEDALRMGLGESIEDESIAVKKFKEWIEREEEAGKSFESAELYKVTTIEVYKSKSK